MLVKAFENLLFWKQFVNVNLLCDLTQSQHSCSLIYSYVAPMRSLSPPYKTRFALMGIIQMCLSHRRDAASTGLVGDGERNTDPVSLVSRSNQNPHNPDATNTATMDISGREAGVKTVSLSLSLLPLICISLSVSFLVSLSVYCSGFVVGNGPSANWYLPFVTAADAKVLEHSGKLQLLLEVLHCAEELQDKV